MNRKNENVHLLSGPASWYFLKNSSVCILSDSARPPGVLPMSRWVGHLTSCCITRQRRRKLVPQMPASPTVLIMSDHKYLEGARLIICVSSGPRLGISGEYPPNCGSVLVPHNPSRGRIPVDSWAPCIHLETNSEAHRTAETRVSLITYKGGRGSSSFSKKIWKINGPFQCQELNMYKKV